MKAPSSPKQITWIIGLVAGFAGIIGHFTNVPLLTEYNFPLLIIGFLILAAGTSLKDV